MAKYKDIVKNGKVIGKRIDTGKSPPARIITSADFLQRYPQTMRAALYASTDGEIAYNRRLIEVAGRLDLDAQWLSDALDAFVPALMSRDEKAAMLG